MAYTALARKYRSRTFSEVIGQDPIATTLANAIRTGRIHHGYLFTGTRGTGKTSMARILAKALNCTSAPQPTESPCCTCDVCRAIGEGGDLDVVEIDAASNTGVDNIRELRSNAAYRPARARFKIFIIDEVHMLSTGAFNALLKTLEEPPPHVKFILATTELQKVPATIQSRCQRFSFRNIGPDEIAGRLAQIASAEGATVEDGVLRRVARLAGGSMRDALSILDQLLSVSPQRLEAAALEELLPPSHDESAFALLTAAAEGDVAGALQAADAALAGGRGLDVLCSDLIDTLRTLMLVRACGADAAIVDLSAAWRPQAAALAARFELSQYVQMIGMLEELRRNIRFSSAGRALLDAVLVRLAHIALWTPVETLLSGGAGLPPPPRAEKKKLTPPAEPDIAPQTSVAAAAAPLVRSMPQVDVVAPDPPPPVAVRPAISAAAAHAGAVRPSSSRQVTSPPPVASPPVASPAIASPPLVSQPAASQPVAAQPAWSREQEQAASDSPVGDPVSSSYEREALAAAQRDAAVSEPAPVALDAQEGPRMRLARAEERAEIEAHPLIQQAMALLDAHIIRIDVMKTEPPATTPE